ncbi:transcriptional regulator [Streptomyces sp. B1866]|uniref:tetratricopeptide repeat protein n=1 Tax=Streptomyces sp. B1866 TaxID=3075431 RepID=UPI0028925AD7|nr:transcriptional regulator [Streptomyces sp. B1866]MDT3397367.1 transcriptional regulator [Streptomyces sp. B1866]
MDGSGDFKRAVTQALSDRGLSMRKAAKLMRYDQAYLSRVLNGTQCASKELLAALDKLLATVPPVNDSRHECADIVEELADLIGSDMDPSRRSIVNAGLASSASLSVPRWDDTTARVTAVRGGQAQRVGMSDVEAVHKLTEQFWDLEARVGGRRARPPVATFLQDTVIPYLRADGPEAVRSAMLSAAAQVCHMAGWMAVDDELHGLADQYYKKSLELAKAAGDTQWYGTTLRTMGVQALKLNQHQRSVQLADAAADVSLRSAAPRKRAFILGCCAASAAGFGDRRKALDSFNVADRSLEQSEVDDASSGYGRPAQLQVLGYVQYYSGDLSGAIESLRGSNALRPPERRRGRTEINLLLADRQFKAGRLDEACATWQEVLTDYPYVRSGSTDKGVATMLKSIEPHLGNESARDLHERARAELPSSFWT